jgi:EPS-associated MarR family transcriptional regulator
MASNKEIREISEDLRHQIFQLLNAHPDINQRELAAKLDVSLGKVNYCLQALIAKGWVKARNFKNSKNKLAYAYFITPVGIEEKARLTFRYLKRKLKEHDELVRVIDELKSEVADIQASDIDFELDYPEQLKDLPATGNAG